MGYFLGTSSSHILTTHSMQNAMPVAEFQSSHAHRHPALDIRHLEDQALVFDHSFEISVKIFQY
jgi:hypothetical protein